MLVLGSAAGDAVAQTAPSAESVTDIDKAIIVDCFLGRGTVRKIGGAMGVRPTPGQRVSGIPFPEAYALPGRPDEHAPATVQDTFRQTQFVLGKDLRLFADVVGKAR